MEDVFAIQDEIAQTIVKALRVILSEDEKKAIEKVADRERRRPTIIYLRGRQYFHQHRRKSLEFARQMFNAGDRDRSGLRARVRGRRRLLLDSLHVLRRARVEPQAGGHGEPEGARARSGAGRSALGARSRYSLSKRYEEAAGRNSRRR